MPTAKYIQSRLVATPRIRIHALESGPSEGFPVILVHGNLASSAYFERLMQSLPDNLRCIAPDLRGYGQTEPKPVDATRGARDWSDDLVSLLDTLEIKRCHLLGWSMGSTAAMQLAIDHSPRIVSLSLLSPLSPFGFGGTIDEKGAVSSADYAGSGAGLVYPEFAAMIEAGKINGHSHSLAKIFAEYFVNPANKIANMERLLSFTLRQQMGERHYPGDIKPSDNWPGFAPGVWGPMNAVSPKYLKLASFSELNIKPPVLWLRGELDQIISNRSAFDLALLGERGVISGWPGEDSCPPQPMVDQMRYLLECYRKNGGRYEEVVLPDIGHSPMLENPDLLAGLLQDFFTFTEKT